MRKKKEREKSEKKKKKDETRKREEEEKREKEKERREHYELSMKKSTNFPLIGINNGKKKGYLKKEFVIKQQWDQQWEEKMMIKGDSTSLEIYAPELAFLPIPNKSMSDQSHTYKLVVCLCNIPFFFFEHCISSLKLFDALCTLVFDHGGRPPKSLIIRDWPLPGSKSQFSRISIFFLLF